MNCLLRPYCFLTLLVALFINDAKGQEDSVHVLNEVIVSGFLHNRPLSEVSASIGVIHSQALTRFSNTSILPAVNTVPGVRMEERSPGSYRFSIRGSLLRSPFGVRNVKFYWNNLPFTDGGGNTYLNLLDFGAIESMEIIKGPGASLYGAGTGGVVLLSSPITTAAKAVDLSLQTGSFGLFRSHTNINLLHSEKNILTFRGSFQKADGYREQTAMERISAGIDWNYVLSPNGTLSTRFLTSNLFYETPGGLTKAQFEQDPTQARPAAGPNPGAVEQKASVNNISHYLSSTYEHEWSALLLKIGLMGSLTEFSNPTIRNYEEREERNLGSRADLQYTTNLGKMKSKFTVGAELQYFYSPVNVYENLQGTKGTSEVKDELWSTNQLYFIQAELDLPKNFYLTLGGSTSFLQYDFERSLPQPTITQTKNFDASFYPRLAVVKKWKESFSVFGSISKGFSPPSLTEVRPSTNNFNNALQPESGINAEIGFRGKMFSNKFTYDVTLYDFQLDETIVLQRAEDGADYFINAGKTSQQGVEVSAHWSATTQHHSLANVWLSYSLNDYFFEEYTQDGNNYSGNRLTGVAPNVASLGLDFSWQKGLYMNTTFQYVDHIPLNDANSEYAHYYWLLGGRLGYRNNLSGLAFDVFAGIDNALNERYSLGHDINAFGGRYYNAAPTRNYYIGLTIKPGRRKAN